MSLLSLAFGVPDREIVTSVGTPDHQTNQESDTPSAVGLVPVKSAGSGHEVRRLTERAIALAGTGIAIFTFDLIFLYPLYRSGEVDAVLFQATLICIVSAISFFSFSTLYFYVLPGQNDNNRRWALFRRGNLFFLLALLLLTAVPFLILFTIRLLMSWA